MLSLAELSIEPKTNPLSSLIPAESRTKISNNAYPVFASLSWAFVMYIFRWYPDTLISSLRSSMVYMYVFFSLNSSIWILSNKYSYSDSDHWDSFRNLLIHNK